MKNITYAVDMETGLVVSRVGSEVAFPVLQYDKMTPENHFATIYELEKMSVFDLNPWEKFHWTKKIPVEIKNEHRAFWGMKPLKVAA